MPELQEVSAPDGHTVLEGLFARDNGAYSQNVYLPDEEEKIAEHGAPSGIYHCVLLVNEKKSNTKKVVVK